MGLRLAALRAAGAPLQKNFPASRAFPVSLKLKSETDLQVSTRRHALTNIRFDVLILWLIV